MTSRSSNGERAATHTSRLVRCVLGTLGASLLGGTLLGCVPRAMTAAPPASVSTPPPDLSATVWGGVYTAEQASRGQVTYRRRCTYCHGVFLDGADDPNGPPLTGLRFINGWRGRTVAQLLMKIAQTMPMDQPGTLSMEVCRDLVAYILQENGMPDGDTALPPDPVSLERIIISGQPPPSRR